MKHWRFLLFCLGLWACSDNSDETNSSSDEVPTVDAAVADASDNQTPDRRQTQPRCGDGRLTGAEICDDGNQDDGDGCDTNCTLSACGNGIVAADEVCDDGNTEDGDGCDSNCSFTGCGNGIQTDGEACDDGNNVDGDGCDSDCRLPQAPTACGDGIENDGEQCDDGNVIDGDGCDSNCTRTACGNGVETEGEACDDGNGISGDGCDTNCTESACGNGVAAPDEGCDDGNVIDGDGCDTNCTQTACGNGIKTDDEMCDDGNDTDGDGCDNNCTETACGNGIKTEGEGCDDGNAINGDGCDSNCTETDCGNGVKDDNEGCDDGNAIDGDGCDAGCTPTGCGNGVVTGDEECDDGNLTSGDGCDENCRITACGNGIRTEGETCDDGNLLDADGCDSNCTNTACGNGIRAGDEACDDGNGIDGDGCDSNCLITACGNGITTDGELCDDGNLEPGDGCEPDCTVTPSCEDGIRNADESDVDCGGLSCGATCPANRQCRDASDCRGGLCEDGRCRRASCYDGLLNGAEGDIDCGGASDFALALALGEKHTCLLLSGQRVRCFGDNSQGQLGTGDQISRGIDADSLGDALPYVRMHGDQKVRQLSSGDAHTCALLDSGMIQCWGNESAFLKLDGEDVEEPGDAAGHPMDDLGGQAVFAGETGGSAGSGDAGGEFTDDPDDGAASGGHADTGGRGQETTAGGAEAEIDDSGGEHAANASDQSDASGSVEEEQTIGQVFEASSGGRFTAVSCGASFVCALNDQNAIRCWGSNSSGQLGAGRSEASIDFRDSAVIALGTEQPVVQVATGRNHACALFDSGQMKCWGRNVRGQLGLGDSQDRGLTPTTMGEALPFVDLGDNRKATTIAAGRDVTCAVLDDKTMKCWGFNQYGQLGQGRLDGGWLTRGTNVLHMGDNLAPIRIGPADESPLWVNVSVGAQHVCGLTTRAQVICWGRNEYGQLGQGDTETRGTTENSLTSLRAVDFGEATNALSVAAGHDHTCALTFDQDVRCWGLNADGALGLGHSRSVGSGAQDIRDTPPVDLGANCALCAANQRCEASSQCASNHCAGEPGQCIAARCGDGILNLEETDTDCGGPDENCARCADGKKCIEDEDCISRNCGDGGFCITATCSDGILNNSEADVDCGDPLNQFCQPCADGSPCTDDAGCLSDICDGGTCVSCDDGQLNGTEADVDCGGTSCEPCTDGSTCAVSLDCANTDCDNGVCISCLDGQVNGDETDMDCGGPSEACARCAGGQSCALDSDCDRGVCTNQRCETCDDGEVNGHETDLDCGGPICDACISRRRCSTHDDCASRNCNDGECVPASCYDSLKNGDEGDLDCGQSRAIVVDVAVGGAHSCMVLASGRIICVGQNDSGQLGIGGTSDVGRRHDDMGSALQNVSITQQFRKVWSGGQHNCGINSTGQLYCWGLNQNGQLGLGLRGNVGDQPTDMGANVVPVDLPTGLEIHDVCLGSSHTCALFDDKKVRCWGGNEKAQLGSEDGLAKGLSSADMGDNLPAVDLGTNVFVEQLTCGDTWTCALLADASIKCWGYNRTGQLGLGTIADRVGNRAGSMGDALPAVELGEGRIPVSVVAGRAHTCARLSDGGIVCWGSNFYNALGSDGPTTRGRQPAEMGDALQVIRLPDGSSATQLALGDDLTCALSQAGSVYCWGKNTILGQAGLGRDDLSIPFAGADHPAVVLNADAQVIAVDAYNQHVCIHLTSEQVQCWGNNEHGELGIGRAVMAVGASQREMGAALQTMDLGRDCPTCANGARCSNHEQCTSDLCIAGRCADASCDDGVRNGTETDIDCGGNECEKCQEGQRCVVSQDCQEAACIQQTCSTCTDGLRAGNETDIDCGGPECDACGPGQTCRLDTDCDTDTCLPVDNVSVCTAPTCDDGRKNGDETDLDCGGVDCQGCVDGSSCLLAGDCASAACVANRCVSCDDGIVNQGESDVDCGGATCSACPDDARCQVGSDCTSGRCVNERCMVATCTDGIKNGNEGALDCGSLAPIIGLGAGEGHACFVFGDGQLRCIGQNDTGQLGLNDAVVRGIDADGLDDNLPQSLPGLNRRFVDIDGGWQHTCALDDSGAVFCWGANTSGQLGSGPLSNLGDEPDELNAQFAPLVFATAHRAIQIETGGAHSCALFENGRVRCWGAGDFGQLGQENPLSVTSTESLPFIRFPHQDPIKQIATGAQHTCVLFDNVDTDIFCFGRGEYGRLGTGLTSDQGSTPNSMRQGIYVKLQATSRAVQIAAGREHSCATFENGEIRCWGRNRRGQLGVESIDDVGGNFEAQPDGPQPVRLGEPADSVALGNEHSCAILRSGAVKCWGSNGDGQLGLGRMLDTVGDTFNDMALNSAPVNLPGNRMIKSIALGTDFTCAHLDDGRPYCWGANRFGQLGLGDNLSRGRVSGELGSGLAQARIGANCAPCDVGQSCTRSSQCVSLDCTDNLRCGYAGCDEFGCPSCWDGLQNGAETDVDCGGPACDDAVSCEPPKCDRCALGQGCQVGGDCESGLCADNICISCNDGQKNGSETDVDCGGDCARPCGVGQGCDGNQDCISTRCDENQRCIP